MPYTPDFQVQLGLPTITTNFNFLSPLAFRLKFDTLLNPNLEYFVQRVDLPEVSVNGAPYYTPQRNIIIPGDKIEYSQLTVDFIIDEDMMNYKEVHDWLLNLVVDNDSVSDDNKARDLTLQILTSHNNVANEIQFVDCIPTTLTTLDFNMVANEIQYLTATVTFAFSYYKFLTKGAQTYT